MNDTVTFIRLMVACAIIITLAGMAMAWHSVPEIP